MKSHTLQAVVVLVAFVGGIILTEVLDGRVTLLLWGPLWVFGTLTVLALVSPGRST